MAGRALPIIGGAEKGASVTRSKAVLLRWLLIGAPSAIIICAFSALWASAWFGAFVTDIEAHEQVIGADPTCGESWAYCSWSNYAWSLVPGSILGIAGLAACAWSAWRRRLGAMPILALLVVLYLAWQAFGTYREIL